MQWLFSLRSIFIGLLLFFFVIGAVFVFISSQVFYESLQRLVAQEKTTVIASAAHLFFDAERAPSSVDELHSLPFPRESIRRVLQIGSQERGVQFFRLIDTDTRKIIVSSNVSEEGLITKRLPEMETGETLFERINSDGSTFVDFTYRDASGLALWLSVEQVFFSGPTLTVTIQQTFLILALITLVGVVFYITANYSILAPIRNLQNSLAKFGQGNFEARLPDGPPNEFGEVFSSFNEMAESVQSAHERDREVSRLKSEFISTAAHQLRTPVSGVRWAFEGLKRGEFGPVSDQQKTVAEQGLQKSAELADIVDTLLHTASLEEGKLEFSFETLPVNELIGPTIEAMQMQAKENGITLRWDASSAQKIPPVSVDREKMKWVVKNVIDNAVRYTQSGGRVDVRAEYERGSDVVHIIVKDTGIGIPEEEKSRMFEKFYRGALAKKMRNEGNGLGLYIAKNIVDSHGGDIWVDSREGEGTRVTFTLPVVGRYKEQEAAQPDEDGEDSEANGESKEALQE